jgi:hypothetical protein
MSHRFIAAEFRGLAREFRRRVEAADAVYGVVLNKIVRPQTRCRRSRGLARLGLGWQHAG